MNNFNLPALIQVLRLNVSFMSRILMLVLVTQLCLIICVWLFVAGLQNYLQIAIATVAAASIAFLLSVYSFAKMMQADLEAPAP